MPEVGVQNDPIHAIVAAAQEILIQSAQPICHGGYARRTPAYFKLPRRGHFFAARSAKKRRFLCSRYSPDTRVFFDGKVNAKGLKPIPSQPGSSMWQMANRSRVRRLKKVSQCVLAYSPIYAARS